MGGWAGTGRGGVSLTKLFAGGGGVLLLLLQHKSVRRRVSNGEETIPFFCRSVAVFLKKKTKKKQPWRASLCQGVDGRPLPLRSSVRAHALGSSSSEHSGWRQSMAVFVLWVFFVAFSFIFLHFLVSLGPMGWKRSRRSRRRRKGTVGGGGWI